MAGSSLPWWNKDCKHHIAKRRGFTRAAFKNRSDVIGARKKHGVAIAPKSHRVPGGYRLGWPRFMLDADVAIASSQEATSRR